MAESIREFLVSYGFGVDTASMSKAESATKAAEDRIVAANAAAVATRAAADRKAQTERISRALAAGEQLTADDRRFVLEAEKNRVAAAERDKKREDEAAKHRRERLDEAAKQVRAFALKAAAVATGVVAAVGGATGGILAATDNAAKGFERLSTMARNSGATVRGLQAFGFGIAQLGGNAEVAEAQVAEFGKKLATFPQFEKNLQSMGIATRDAAGHMKDATEIAKDFFGVLAKMPRAQQDALGNMYGFDEETIRAGTRPGLGGYMAQERSHQAQIGANADEAGERGTEFERSMRRLQDDIAAVKTKIETALFDLFKPALDRVAGWVEEHGKAISGAVIAIAKGIGDVVAAFVNTGIVKDSMKALSDGLENFASYINSGEFRKDIKNFASDVMSLARWIRSALDYLGILPAKAGAPYVPSPTGDDADVGGASGGAGASLRNRRGGQGHQDSNPDVVHGRLNNFRQGRGIASGANPEVADYIAHAAAERGIDPRVALAVAGTEGLNGYDPSKPDGGGDKGTSFGPFQLHYKSDVPGFTNSGMGDDFTKATGKHASDPSTWKAQVDFALDHAKQHGWRNWHGWNGKPANAGLGMDPAEAAKLIPPKPAPKVAPAPVTPSGDATGQIAGDLSGQATYNNGQLAETKGLIFHHTGGRGTPEGVVQTLNQRGLGVQYVMDRDGKMFRTLPSGARGAHILRSEINDLNNGNTQGVEVIAKDDNDVTPAQVASGKAFAAEMTKRYPGLQVFGHGEVNPSHKMASEGHAIVAAIRATGNAPRVDPNYVPPPVPMAQRTLQGYMGRDPVKVDVIKATPLSEASKEVAQHLANLKIQQAASHGLLHPLLHGSALSPVEAMRRSNHYAIKHGNTATINHLPTYNVAASTADGGLDAAKRQGERGAGDLVRNIQPMLA